MTHPRAWTTPLNPNVYLTVLRVPRNGGSPGPRHSETVLGLGRRSISARPTRECRRPGPGGRAADRPGRRVEQREVTTSEDGAALAATAMNPVNRDLYQAFINFDSQGTDQQWEEWRATAALLATSGHSVGHVCAALCGVLVGTLAAGRRLRLAVALLAGAGLAAINTALTLPRAKAEVGRLWMIGDLRADGFSRDTNLLHPPRVVAVLVCGLVAFPLWAALGLGFSMWRGPRRAAVTMSVWYPVAIVFGGCSLGVAGLVLPVYSNLGTTMLAMQWPASAFITTLVLTLWAVGTCIHGFATDILGSRPVRTGLSSEYGPGSVLPPSV